MPASKKRNVTVPGATKPQAAKQSAPATKPAVPVTTAPVAVPTAVAADTSAAKLATRETRNADYLARATYPAERLSPADRAYLATFAISAKANAGTINLAALDIADRAANRLVNNRARAVRLAKLGYLSRTGDAATTARFTFVPAVTGATVPTGAAPDMLAARTIYASAK